MTNHPIIIGITGASGACYGITLLKVLKEISIPTHLIISKSARLTIASETNLTVPDIEQLADEVHPAQDVGASISSGSYKTRGMIVAPCSMKSLAEIATGNTTSLLSRAADVTLKERRRLVLMVRETPLHSGHLRNMTLACDMGAIIAPPVPAFYTNPQTLDDIVMHSVGRVLDLFDLEHKAVTRWQGMRNRQKAPATTP